MSNQTKEALRAGIDRLFEHRKILRRASTLLRIWPDGLVFECIVTAHDAEDYRVVSEANGREVIFWDQLDALDAATARDIADRVCAKAHAVLGTRPAGSDDLASGRAQAGGQG